MAQAMASAVPWGTIFLSGGPAADRPRPTPPRAMFEQLSLPLSGILAAPEPTRIPRTRRVFVNRNLKMAGIDWIGFDMDYTLAIYNQTEMDKLSIDATVDKLVGRGYAAEILRSIQYRIDFPIRG